MSTVFENEKHYIASNKIKVTYLEDPFGIANYKGKKKLLVIFQCLGDEKSSKDGERFPWTMVNGFKFLNCRKIYIKDDYGAVGCYYLGLHGSFGVEKAILEFLKSKIIEYGILMEDILFYGNSKGGYAALDFGFKLGGVNICAAVPQYDLLQWIEKYKPHLRYILPDEITPEIKEKYSTYLKNTIVLSKTKKPKVCIITSHNDNTYEDHIPALIQDLEACNVDYEVWYCDELYITRHNNVVVNSMNEILYCILRWLVS